MTLLLACNQNQQRFYATRLDADRSGEFDQGWLPVYLPATSHSIHLTFDKSHSRVWCAFEFNPADVGIFLFNVKPVDPHALPTASVPNPRVDWWPKVLEGDIDVSKTQAAGLILYKESRALPQVTNDKVLFAIDRANGRGYFYGM